MFFSLQFWQNSMFAEGSASMLPELNKLTMYKVFINDRLFQLVPLQDSLSGVDLVLKLKGDEPSEYLKELVQAFESNSATESLILQSPKIDATWNTFLELFNVIEAAGGIVYNPDHLMLMIFRNGKWDLPKGKIEKGEDAESAAIREVEEECGVCSLSLIKQLPTTYHTYKINNKNYLKKSYWFLMASSFTGKLIPQKEEGITEVRWMNNIEVQNALKNTYSSISDLLKDQLLSDTSSHLG
jgi:8-oxo-dGTP pyrophosphatase MutT (NUDIX family)